MAARTRLYQQPRSPLIEGRSARERPFWRPWLAGCIAVVVWIGATVYLAAREAAAAGGSVWQHASDAWPADLPWLIAGGVFGSALGVVFARIWGIRARWLLASVFGIGGAYLLSWAVWAIGRLGG